MFSTDAMLIFIYEIEKLSVPVLTVVLQLLLKHC